MSRRFDGKVAVVTGGASGIGRATVLRFVSEGASVVVGDLNADALQQLHVDVEDPKRLHTLRTNVADESAVEALVGSATERFGGLDITFLNAGTGGAFGPLTEIDVAHWDNTFAVLVRSVFLGIKHSARTMIAQGRGGCIVNTASIAGVAGGGGPQAYSAAKAAVINLTYNAAEELAEHRIRVNAVCPGVIFTPLLLGRDEEQIAEAVSRLQPWPDRGTGDDIAGAVTWLASDDASFVTGEAIRVDGGIVAAGTRAAPIFDPRGSLKRYVGIAHGTTGLPPERRRIS